MATLDISWDTVVRALLKEKGIPANTVKRISFGLDGVGLTTGFRGMIHIDHQDLYPVLCMDCSQPTEQVSTCEHSTGLCEGCYEIRDERAKLRDALISRVVEDMG